MSPRTLLDKVWDDHKVSTGPDGEDLLYVDRHFIHEVSSPQAFAALRERGRTIRRPDLTFGVSDHIVSTALDRTGGDDPAGEEMLQVFRANVREHRIAHLDLAD